MPQGHVCCGRPLYDYGFLDVAERYLHRVLDVLRDDVRAGTPVVGMEPSCLAVFKDELTQDAAARRRRAAAGPQRVPLRRVLRPASTSQPPRLDAQGGAVGPLPPPRHRRHRPRAAGAGADGDDRRAGQAAAAAAWPGPGASRAASTTSRWRAGSRRCCPPCGAADPDTVIVANGFSCKTQIADAGTGRRALHLAQVMAMAREHGTAGYRGGPPEKAAGSRPAPGPARRAARIGVPVGVVAAGAAAAGLAITGRRS